MSKQNTVVKSISGAWVIKIETTQPRYILPTSPYSTLLFLIFDSREKKMTSFQIICPPPDHIHWIEKLFHLNDGILMSREQFDLYWPLADGFWTMKRKEKQRSGMVETRYDECRTRKSRKSSGIRGIPQQELDSHQPVGQGQQPVRRITSYRINSTCECKLRIVEQEDTFSLERYGGRIGHPVPIHDHTMDDSFARKISSFLREALLVELRKGYTTAEVFNRFCGVGRVNGYDMLESVGGAWLIRYYSPS